MPFDTSRFPARLSEDGATIGTAHTWRDFGLQPTRALTFPPPTPKLNYIDVPMMMGDVDNTGVLGGLVYSARAGEWTLTAYADENPWPFRESVIATALAGAPVDCVLDSEPAYKYTGRFWLADFTAGKDTAEVKIGYHVNPQKTLRDAAISVPWLFDDIIDNNGTIYGQAFDAPPEGVTVTVVNPLPHNAAFGGDGEGPNILVTVAGNLTVTYNGADYSFTSSAQDGITLPPGRHALTFRETVSSSPTAVTITYAGATEL